MTAAARIAARDIGRTERFRRMYSASPCASPSTRLAATVIAAITA
jgi:hypothetical protein